MSTATSSAGRLKIKLGPIRMTYMGTATIVEKDEVRHRARIEATGNAGGSTSTAAMMVTATATELAPNKTAVDLVTTLSLTGRPAQFGRGVMVDVGNKLIGQFADCVSNKLAGRTSGGAELIDVVNPDEVAADFVAPPEAARTATGAAAGTAAANAPCRAQPAVRHRHPDPQAGGADRAGHHRAVPRAEAPQEASGGRGRSR